MAVERSSPSFRRFGAIRMLLLVGNGASLMAMTMFFTLITIEPPRREERWVREAAKR